LPDETANAPYAGPGAPLQNGFSVATSSFDPLPFTPPAPGRIDIHAFLLEPTSSVTVVYDDSVPVVACPGPRAATQPPAPTPQQPPQQKIKVPTAVVQTGRYVFIEDESQPQSYRLIRGTTDPAWDRPDRVTEILFDGTGHYYWF